MYSFGQPYVQVDRRTDLGDTENNYEVEAILVLTIEVVSRGSRSRL
jgi:hypothetical protein